jgi:hypothetical protein
MYLIVNQIQASASIAGLIASVALVFVMTRSLRCAKKGQSTLIFEFGLACIAVLGVGLIASSIFAAWFGADLISAACTSALGIMFVIVPNNANRQLAQERSVFRLMSFLLPQTK